MYKPQKFTGVMNKLEKLSKPIFHCWWEYKADDQIEQLDCLKPGIRDNLSTISLTLSKRIRLQTTHQFFF